MNLPNNLVGCNFVIVQSLVNTMCLFKWVTLLENEIINIIGFEISPCNYKCKITIRQKPDRVLGLKLLIVGYESEVELGVKEQQKWGKRTQKRGGKAIPGLE